ncbi:hypothetical protein GPL10_07880 [Bacteroides fragilis]|uniref:hypothetical protein n=1 Tax=Bacteroides fragilis TaxID=817 RepID=UPI0011C021FC|nr:hypothetical protein [Bacteroides fragilis]MBT9905714.1 hypothetical protein [Bacteroides fragilis]
MKFDSIVNLPIMMVYVLFPIVSLLGTLIFAIRIDYEPLWLIIIVCIPLLSKKTKISKKHFLFYIFLLLLVLIKYIIPCFIWWEITSFRPLIMDFKWVVYLFGSLLWIDLIGMPSKKIIWKAGLFFCWIYILYGVYIIISTKGFNRFELISEANYDGFLLLIPFCFLSEIDKNKKDIWLFVIATLMTGSRTGCMVMFVLLSYLFCRKKPIVILLLLPFGIIYFYFLLFVRDSLDPESIDRYIFFYQSYLYFSDVDVLSFLFGVSPGISLDMPVLPSFEWYINNFEEMNNIIGIYSFYFHSAYIRFAIVWGVPICFLVFIYFFVRFFKIQYLPLKLLLIVIFLQSISLSTFTLTNVSFILFLVFFIMLKAEKEIHRTSFCHE